MSTRQCPICYSPLEVRDVTPCFACGGASESVARFDPATAFTESRLPSGRLIVLCPGCELEEFMVPGGWGEQLCPGETLPVNGLQRVRPVEEPRVGRDQFCPTCNLRLAMATMLADHECDPDSNGAEGDTA